MYQLYLSLWVFLQEATKAMSDQTSDRFRYHKTYVAVAALHQMTWLKSSHHGWRPTSALAD